MFYRSNILKEFQEHISKLDTIELYRLLQDIMNKIEEESVLYDSWYTQLENINDNMQVSIMSYEQSQTLKASLYNNAAIEYIRQEALNCNIEELSIIVLAFIDSGIKLKAHELEIHKHVSDIQIKANKIKGYDKRFLDNALTQFDKKHNNECGLDITKTLEHILKVALRTVDPSLDEKTSLYKLLNHKDIHKFLDKSSIKDANDIRADRNDICAHGTLAYSELTNSRLRVIFEQALSIIESIINNI